MPTESKTPMRTSLSLEGCRLASCLLLAWAGTTHAGIQIAGTRVIYKATEREATVNVMNNGDSPRLVQAWIDDGDAKVSAQDSTAPFLITPPMSRVDAGKGQTLRLIHTGGDEPADRETVYWLNVLEIPPNRAASDDGADNRLQFAIRSRIKIFYRPPKLPGSPETAHRALSWKVQRQADGFFAECSNPTAYNVSFTRVDFKRPTDNPAVPEVNGGGMCPAKGTASIRMPTDAIRGEILALSVINDYGGVEHHEAPLTP